MDEVGCQVCQEDEDESAFVQVRVRDGQLRGIENQVIVEEDVHVNPARSPADSREAAEFVFQMFQAFQKIHRSQGCSAFEHHIQEGGLGGETPGRRLVYRRLCKHADGGREGGNGGLEIGEAVAEVGAEGEVEDGHWVDRRAHLVSALLYSLPIQEAASNHLTRTRQIIYTGGEQVLNLRSR